jgi:hypothetical protein
MKILLFILLLPLSVFADMMSFSVSPGIVKFETVQGGIKTFDLSFFNQGDKPLQANIQIMDLSLNTNGVPVMANMSKKIGQWSKFVTLNKKGFVVNAKQSEKIHVTIKIPRGVTGGGYFAIVFNTSNVNARNKSKRIKNIITIGGQLPTLFIGEVSRTGERNVKVVKGVINKAPYSKDKPFKLRFTLKNTGTTHTNVKGDILLRYNNKVIKRLKLESGSGLILPKGERYFVATWDDYAKHSNKRIQAEARFSYYGGRVNKKITFKVP